MTRPTTSELWYQGLRCGARNLVFEVEVRIERVCGILHPDGLDQGLPAFGQIHELVPHEARPSGD